MSLTSASSGDRRSQAATRNTPMPTTAPATTRMRKAGGCRAEHPAQPSVHQPDDDPWPQKPGTGQRAASSRAPWARSYGEGDRAARRS